MNEPTYDLPSESPQLPPLPPTLSHAIENIDSILVDQVVSSRDGGTRYYLVKWRGRPESENSWITEEDLRRLGYYRSQTTTFQRTLNRVEFFPFLRK